MIARLLLTAAFLLGASATGHGPDSPPKEAVNLEPAGTTPRCLDEESLELLLAALEQERAGLAERARELDRRETALEQLRLEVGAGTDRLERARLDLEAVLARHAEARDEARARAALSLARMRPAQSARLVVAMEQREAGASLNLIQALDPVSAGRLLEALARDAPELAARLLGELAAGPRPTAETGPAPSPASSASRQAKSR